MSQNRFIINIPSAIFLAGRSAADHRRAESSGKRGRKEVRFSSTVEDAIIGDVADLRRDYYGDSPECRGRLSALSRTEREEKAPISNLDSGRLRSWHTAAPIGFFPLPSDPSPSSCRLTSGKRITRSLPLHRSFHRSFLDCPDSRSLQICAR